MATNKSTVSGSGSSAPVATSVEKFLPKAIVVRINICPICGKRYSPVSFLSHNILNHNVKFTDLGANGIATITMRWIDWRLNETKCVGAIAYVGSGVESDGNLNLAEEYNHLRKSVPIIYWARLDERKNGDGHKEEFMTFGVGAVPTTGVLVFDVRVLELEEEICNIDDLDLFSNSTDKKKHIHVEFETKNFMNVNTTQFWTGKVDKNKVLILEIALRGFAGGAAIAGKSASNSKDD